MVDVLLSASTEKRDKAKLARVPNLKMVAFVLGGFSNIDLGECGARDIAVSNVPGMNSGAVADLAVAMTPLLLRRIPKMQDHTMTVAEPVLYSKFPKMVVVAGSSVLL